MPAWCARVLLHPRRLTRASLDRYLRPERSKSMPAASRAADTSALSGGTSAPGASAARTATLRRGGGGATPPARRACTWRAAAAGCVAGAATAARMVCSARAAGEEMEGAVSGGGERRQQPAAASGGDRQGVSLGSSPACFRALVHARCAAWSDPGPGRARGRGGGGPPPRSGGSCGIAAMASRPPGAPEGDRGWAWAVRKGALRQGCVRARSSRPAETGGATAAAGGAIGASTRPGGPLLGLALKASSPPHSVSRMSPRLPHPPRSLTDRPSAGLGA